MMEFLSGKTEKERSIGRHDSNRAKYLRFRRDYMQRLINGCRFIPVNSTG